MRRHPTTRTRYRAIARRPGVCPCCLTAISPGDPIEVDRTALAGRRRSHRECAECQRELARLHSPERVAAALASLERTPYYA
jgi:hypothetical protein